MTGLALIPIIILAWKISNFIENGDIYGYCFDWIILAFFAFACAISPFRNLEIDMEGQKVRFTSRCLIYNKKIELDIPSIETVKMTKNYTLWGHGGATLTSKVIVFGQKDGTETPPMPENARELPYYDSFSGSVWQKKKEKK